MTFNFSVDLLLFEKSRAQDFLDNYRFWSHNGKSGGKNRVIAEVSANFTAVVHTCSYYTFIHCYFPKKRSDLGAYATVESDEA